MTTRAGNVHAEDAPVALAMDWGGTWARAAVIDRQGSILWHDRVSNQPGALQDQLVHAAGGLLQTAKDWAGGRTIAGAGIALAGSIDAASNMLLSSPNLPALNGVTLPALWEPILGAPVWVGNDANLAALGEYYYGAGRPVRPEDMPSRTLVFITFSTGVGAGIVDRGAVFTGAVGAAGEVGHMTIDLRADAPQCACGNSGCLEALASGTAIARAAMARLGDATPGSPLQQAYEANAALTGEAVFTAAARGDYVALEVIDAAVGAIIVGLGNVLNIFNPDVVVMGGGVTIGLQELGLLGQIEDGARRRAMSSGHRAFRLAPATFGDSQGMVGAASLVWAETGRG
jgi:glucokinase